MKIKVKSNAREFAKGLRGVGRQIPFAGSLALNEVAWKIREKEIEALTTNLDRPTPFTKRGYLVKKATKRNLVAYIYTNKVQGSYLSILANGGQTIKKHAVPGRKQKLNAYGNLPKTATKRKRTFSMTTKKGVSGVWQRVGRGKSATIVLVAHFPKSRTYRQGTLPFNAVANRTASANFKKAMARAIRRATR